MSAVTGPSGAPLILLKPLGEHLSFSQVAKLDTSFKYGCARAWAYSYRLGIPFKTAPAVEMGSALDEGANLFFEQRGADVEYIEAANAGIACATARLRQGWADNEGNSNFDGKAVSEFVSTLQDGAELYFSHHRETIPMAVQTRHTFRFRAREGEISVFLGFSDRIDADGTIVDLKVTSSNKVDKYGNWDERWVHEKQQQITTYYIARLGEARTDNLPEPPRKGRIEMVYMKPALKTPQLKTLDFDITQAMIEDMLGKIRRAWAVKHSGIYPANPGPACSFCDHRDRCATDLAATSPRFEETLGAA